MTQNYEIKNCWNGEVLFTCKIPEGMESWVIARHALEAAIAGGANLIGANLIGANLIGAKNAPITISGLRWFVVINGLAEMQIGCQRHSVEEWKLFNDKQISSMGNGALEFWNKYKTMILAVCETHVHTKQEEV